MSLSQNIKKYRLKKGLTQKQLADSLGVSAQAVSKWETGDAYPDGPLFLKLAEALETSLDTLFKNDVCSVGELSAKIQTVIQRTPQDRRMHLVRDLCWQMEKGLFGCSPEDGYHPEEIFEKEGSSYILTDGGFTHISNGVSPFFSVFPEYGDAYSAAIGDGEKLRKVFAALSSPETMRAVLWIHQKEANCIFEAAVPARDCGISDDRIDDVLNDLLFLGVAARKEVEINGTVHTLYKSKPSHEIIALLLFAGELLPQTSYCLQSDLRTKPYLSPLSTENSL